jgi:hypothetical protein
MHLIYNGFIAVSLTAVPVAASAQMTPPATQQSVPDEPTTTPPSTPAQNPTAPDQMQPPAEQGPAATAATAADVKAGAAVYDPDGGTVGKIGAVSGDQAVIDTGSVRAKVPISSLAKNDKGLVIGMTKAELEAAAKEKSPPK